MLLKTLFIIKNFRAFRVFRGENLTFYETVNIAELKSYELPFPIDWEICIPTSLATKMAM